MWFGMKAGVHRIIGLLIGLFGAALLILGNGNSGAFSAANSYALIIVLATVCYAFGVNILRYKLSGLDSIRTTGFALFFVGIPMGIYLFSGDFVSRTMNTPGAGFSMSCIVILGIMGTAVSSVLFNRLIKLSGALSAASVTYLIPIVATIWGFADGEKLGVFQLAGLGAVLSGVYLINRTK